MGKQVSGTMKLDLAQFTEMGAFAKFGSDLDAATQQQLNRGVRLQELLKQDQYVPYEAEEQVVILFAGVRGYIDRVDVSQVQAFEKAWLDFIKLSHPDVLSTIKEEKENQRMWNGLTTRTNECIYTHSFPFILVLVLT